MGAAQANVTKQALTDLTEINNKVVNTVKNQSISNCNAINIGNLLIGVTPDNVPCLAQVTNNTFNYSQGATASCQLTSQNVTESISDFANTIANQISQETLQGSKSIQDWLAVAVSVQVNEAQTSTEIINRVSTYVRNTVTNICQNDVRAMNDRNVVICGFVDGNTFNLNQDASVTALTSCINRSILEAFAKDDVLNEVAQKTDQKLSSEQKGLGSVLLWVVIGIAGVIILALIVWLIIRALSGNTPAPTLVYRTPTVPYPSPSVPSPYLSSVPATPPRNFTSMPVAPSPYRATYSPPIKTPVYNSVR